MCARWAEAKTRPLSDGLVDSGPGRGDGHTGLRRSMRRGRSSRVVPGLVMRGGFGQLSTVMLTPELNVLPTELKASDTRT
jgi:hypothetical protein